MGHYIKLDVSQTAKFIDAKLYENLKKEVIAAHELLRSKKGAGNDFLGWLDLPVAFDTREFARLQQAAEKIKKQSAKTEIINAFLLLPLTKIDIL